MINPQKAIEWYKGKYGDSNQSDYNIYEYLKRKWLKDSNKDYIIKIFSKVHGKHNF